MKRKITYLAAAIILAMSLAACGKSPRHEFRSQGIEQIKEGNYEAALLSFQQALEESDGMVGNFEKDVLKYRAEAEFMTGDYGSAAESYGILIQVDQELPFYQYMKLICDGRIYEENGEYENAYGVYEQACTIDPGQADVYNQMGLCKMKMEQYSEAVTLFQTGIELNQAATLPSLIYNQAICHEYLNDYETALANLEDYVARYGSDETVERELAFLRSR